MGRRSTKAARDAGAAPSFDTVGMTILPGRALPEWAEPTAEEVEAPEPEAREVLEAAVANEVASAVEQIAADDARATDQGWAATTAQHPPAAAGVGAPEPAYAMAGAAMAAATMSAAAPQAPPAGAHAPAPHGAYGAPPSGAPTGVYASPPAPSPAAPQGAPASGAYTPPNPAPTSHAEATYAPPGAAPPAQAYAEPSRYPAAPAAGLAAAAGAATTAASHGAAAPPATAAAPDSGHAPAGYAPAGYGQPAAAQSPPGQPMPSQVAGHTPPSPPAPSQAYRQADAPMPGAQMPEAQMPGAQVAAAGMVATGTQTLTAPAPTDPESMGQPTQAPTAEPGAAPSQVRETPERPELSAEHVALLSWWADMIAAGNFPTPPGAPETENTLEPPPSRPEKGRGRAGNSEGSARERSFPTKAVVIGLAALVALGAAAVMGPKVLAAEESLVVPATELTMPATVGDLVAITDPAIGIQLQPLIGFGLRPKGVTVTAAYGPTTEGPLSLAAMSTRMGAPAEPVSQIATWAARSDVTTSASVSGSGAEQGITCAAAEATEAIPAGSLCVWTGSGMRGQTYSVEMPVEDAMALTADLRAGMTTT